MRIDVVRVHNELIGGLIERNVEIIVEDTSVVRKVGEAGTGCWVVAVAIGG